jgi:hypothetical protein
MIARCVRNSGKSLGSPERGHFYTVDTVFFISTEAEYPILGLGIFESVLLALVKDDTDKPRWLPVGLFEFDFQKIPTDWEFALHDGRAASGGDASDRWVARWGYPELVRDESHSDGLIEGDVHALETFTREVMKRTNV